MNNTELNDLEKSFVLRKSEDSVKEFQFIMPLKIWRSMAYPVCYAPKFKDVVNRCNCNNYDIIVMPI